MTYCGNCGASIPDGKLSCPECGAKVTPPPLGEAYRGARAEGGYASAEPAFVYADRRKAPDRVLGVGAYFGSLLLMGLPVIGFFVQLIWALGGARSLNRKNLARATLILTVLGLISGWLLYLLVSRVVLPEVLDLLRAYGFDIPQFEGYNFRLF